MLELLTFNNLSAFSSIVHFQTTRHGGCSLGDFGSLNLSFTTGDNPDHVAKNRNLLADKLKLPLDCFVMAHQTHTDNIMIVSKKDRGRGAFMEYRNDIYNTDAFVTNEKGIMICVKTADCIPVLCYDKVKKVIAAIHAGWSGTAQSISLKSIELMKSHYNSDPKDIVVGIGAGAGVCCYEVDKDVLDKLTASISSYYNRDDYYIKHGDKYKVDLKLINKIQLEYSGVLSENIETNHECTICNPKKYFSWRAKPYNDYGHLATGIFLMENE